MPYQRIQMKYESISRRHLIANTSKDIYYLHISFDITYSVGANIELL